MKGLQVEGRRPARCILRNSGSGLCVIILLNTGTKERVGEH